MYFSIGNRRAYVVIVKTAFTLAVLYVFIPTTVIALSRPWLWKFSIPKIPLLASAFMLCNPLTVMSLNTSMMMSPSATGGPFGAFLLRSPIWLGGPHCGIMLGASALLLAWSVKVVRKTALRQATSPEGFPSLGSRVTSHVNSGLEPRSTINDSRDASIRRVGAMPVLWKELRAPTIQGPNRKNGIIGLAVTIAALLITYGICSNTKCLDADSTHISYTLLFIIIGLIITMMLSATSITSEKESRSWPILLATSMDDWHILLGKALAVFRRCLPIWLLLASHVTLFVLAKYIHPIAIVHLFVLVAWLVVFVTGSGMYFSTRFKRTTSAVVANFALALILWVVTPMLLGLVAAITRDTGPVETCLLANPVVQAAVIVGGACGPYSARARLSGLEYYRLYDRSMLHIGSVTAILMVTAIAYILVGLLFAWRAKYQFRRNIFTP
jgi:ABC-type transport system involved in multi-copper enzyme maturation permease subunit